MLVLCLDTATADVAAAVVDLDDPERTATAIVRDARGAGERLMPLALEALAGCGAELADLAAIGVGLGPGPFTGLRAGVVTGAVLARSLGVPAYGCCSLDLYASAHALVVTDARRREVYWAAYDAAGRRGIGPHVDSPAVLARRLAADLGGHRVTGPGAVLYPAQLGTSPDIPLPITALAELIADRVRAGAPTEVLVPLYLRRPDATEPVPA
ncbi:MAG TPA: tRNA (adenosine(37)-N6)-threonylcarbamoyltransferase complex dimerization subunit type 1 TsaB [Mycobacteriales bacterium]|nr:tRNA (adenosine(37)-N6)-threonylcarbamoyltransferase complex dimerization subunit type 1 TsaB [Mycobacteriales bacterium]